jgi:hypothetical protein
MLERLMHQLAVDLHDALHPGHFFFRQAAQRFQADRIGHAQQRQAAHGAPPPCFGEVW